MRYKRWQYESHPFTPIHDWVLTPVPELSWQSVFPDFARRNVVLAHLYSAGPSIPPLISLPDIPVNHLGWLPQFADFVLRRQRRPHLGGGDVEPWLFLPDTASIISQGWLPHFPDFVSRPRTHPARMGGAAFTGVVVPPLTDVAQFPCLYQRQPDFVHRPRTPAHLIPAFTRREHDTFGVWIEPGVTPITSTWTEPGIAPITSTWTEPGVSPSTSVWTEPGVTPITPSPDRTT